MISMVATRGWTLGQTGQWQPEDESVQLVMSRFWQTEAEQDW